MLKKIIVRIVIIALPLVTLYAYFLMESEANSRKEHPTDVGLGIAIMLFFILTVLVIGFSIDLIKRLHKKHYKVAFIDLSFLSLFILPILYINCQMGGCCDDFCDGYINFMNRVF
ncbi:hypothetical protein I2486_13940 [Cellulophaga sp. E16_2]|uniref:hypothetical protein n=1 Tax=Cellulophaga sp. E16_2 TaxID=2789297 RepID=UPI001A911E67|nr:hypothetical protein [Cellulophaga sp. E16_2]MBO0592503.1 hypothetical protein [Cellulophaga sp. E16_2]